MILQKKRGHAAITSRMDLLQVASPLQEAKHNSEIFGVTERHIYTRIAGTKRSRLKAIATFVRNNSKNGPGGGVVCFVLNDPGWQREDREKDGLETIFIEILVKNARPLHVCVLYRLPDNSKYLDRNFESDFSDMVNISVSENKELILVGDLSTDYLNTSKTKK